MLIYSCKTNYFVKDNSLQIGSKLIIDSINNEKGKIICNDTVFKVDIVDIFKNNAVFLTKTDGFNLKQIKHNGIVYNIGLNDYNYIRIVGVSDSSFITPENLKIGMHYNEIKENDKAGNCYYISGWGYYQKLKSGWIAYFNFNETNNSMLDSTILSFNKEYFTYKKRKKYLYNNVKF